jgi:acyl carrier protein
MSEDEIRAKIKESITRITGIPVGDIPDTQTYREDLGLDSLAMLEIAVDAEYHFHVKIPDERLPEIKTVQDTIRIVSEQLAFQGA